MTGIERVSPQDKQADETGHPLHDLVSQYPPLTSEETRRNLEIIRKGKEAASLLKKSSNLTPEQKNRLEEEQRQGLIAKEKVILRHTRLVLGKAAARQSFRRSTALGIEDLFQEGTIGLINSTEKFDLQRDTSFACYATAGIFRAIRRAIQNQENPVRLPVYCHAQLKDIREAQNRLQQELGRPPSVEELSTATGIKTSKILSLIRNSQKQISLEEKIGDSNRAFEDLIADPNEVSPETAVLKKLKGEAVRKAFACLEPIERGVIELLLGFTADGPLSLRQVGKRFGGRSGEWARQVKIRAFKKLKERLLAEI